MSSQINNAEPESRGQPWIVEISFYPAAQHC
jgi:hypothetical protein